MLCTASPLCPFLGSRGDCSPHIPEESLRPVYVRAAFSFATDDSLLFVKTSDICLGDDFRTLLFPVVTIPDVIEIISFSDLLNRLIGALQFCCPIRNGHVLIRCIILVCVLCKNKSLEYRHFFIKVSRKLPPFLFSMRNNHEKLRIKTL